MRTLTPGWLAPKVFRVLFGLFLLLLAVVWTRLWLPQAPFGSARWPEGLLVVLAAATVLASLARQLPGQNVMLAGVIIAFISAAVQSLGTLIASPFESYAYSAGVGQQLFYPLPWAIPLIWITAILASRGVARLILRPWHKTGTYGFQMLGLTTALVVLLHLGLEPFAVAVQHVWLCGPSELTSGWYGARWLNFVGWAITSLLILAFITPSLMNKKPGPPPSPDYSSLAVWLLINALFATGAAVHHLWPALGLISLASLSVALAALAASRAA